MIHAVARPLFAAVLLVALGAAGAGEEGPRDPLRVGTSGDYAPFSGRASAGEAPDGFDLSVARAYAADRGLELELVTFRWPHLLADLRAGRFDVAMSGVTVLPERSVAGRFTTPVVETGAVLLVRQPERWVEVGDLDRPDVRIGVNAGGHLEQVARAHFPRATLLAIPDNAAVRRSLLEGHVNAAVTDTLEAPQWLEGETGLALLGPFTRDRKAYLVQADRSLLAADLDAWLLEREADGSLSQWREGYLGVRGEPVATPLRDLLAAIDERLSLMPWVGAVKRRDGLPLEVPEREEFVLDAAVTAVNEAAARDLRPPPPERAVRNVFRAQIEAAKQVQWDAVRDPQFEPPAELPDLDMELRPALLAIGERIARLLVLLPDDLDEERALAATAAELRTPRLSEAARREIGLSLARLAESVRQSRVTDRAASPASSGSSRQVP